MFEPNNYGHNDHLKCIYKISYEEVCKENNSISSRDNMQILEASRVLYKHVTQKLFIGNLISNNGKNTWGEVFEDTPKSFPVITPGIDSTTHLLTFLGQLRI